MRLEMELVVTGVKGRKEGIAGTGRPHSLTSLLHVISLRRLPKRDLRDTSSTALLPYYRSSTSTQSTLHSIFSHFRTAFAFLPSY